MQTGFFSRNSLSDNENIKQSRAAPSSSSAARLGRSGCRLLRFRRRRCRFGCNQKDVIVLCVERARLRAGFGLDGLLDLEAARALFLDDRQGAISLGAEGLHRFGVETATVSSFSDWEGRNDRAVFRVQNDYGRRLMTKGKEN